MTATALSRVRLCVGTRASALARAQSRLVTRELARLTGRPLADEVVIVTEGDRDQATPLPVLAGRGVFTEALERALLAGEIDFAVHSLKDMPVDSTPGLAVGAVCFREDARDVLVVSAGRGLDDLMPGSIVGTCSVRRTAQLLHHRPDLTIRPLRGNVDTRLARLDRGEYDAIVLAAAGLRRLALAPPFVAPLSLALMLPAPGQGALAVQCRADDVATHRLLARIDDPLVRAATNAERAFLEGLGGGCLAPIAAHADVDGGSLVLDGLVASVDGVTVIRVTGSAPLSDGRDLGLRLAADAVASGALDLLA